MACHVLIKRHRITGRVYGTPRMVKTSTHYQLHYRRITRRKVQTWHAMSLHLPMYFLINVPTFADALLWL
ncbi:MAG: hypothetical protein HDS16_07490 [Bacteroides sp.]|nr:hypothetical protein [Bacteroides sp.]